MPPANSTPSRTPARITVLAGSATYTPTPGTTAILVECVGGGGGGGGSDGAASSAGAAGGGGSGGYSRKLIVQPAPSYSYAVGAGGNGGLAQTNGADGSAGTDTTFGSTIITAKGGSGGKASGTAGSTVLLALGGAGGAAGSGGDLNLPGNVGAPGVRLTGAIAISGNGGNSPLAGGAVGLIAAATGTAGTAGTGAGGAGGLAIGTTDQAGGPGGAGTIIVTEYVG